MKHYVLTRSYRGPDYPLEANRRRIEITRRITAPSMAVQGGKWTWLVYIDPADPLLRQRLDAFASAGVPVIPVPTTERVEDYIDWSGPVLTTRIDDDDAFARDAFDRLRAALRPKHRRSYIFPWGHRVSNGRVKHLHHYRNAWCSLLAPKGDRTHVRQIQHLRIGQLARRAFLDDAPAFLWVRHQDSETGFRSADDEITDDIRARYAVDWPFLESLT